MPRRIKTILDGMPLTTLQTNLANLQQAYLDLASGAKGQSYSYTNGEGSRAVTYTAANLPALTDAIRLLQLTIDEATGQRDRSGPIRPYFR